MKRRSAGSLRSEDVGQRVLLKAWVERRRDLGGLIFLDLRDRGGIGQVVIYPEDQPELAEASKEVRSEWVLEIEGAVAHREEGNVNSNLPSGEVELVADRLEVLSKSAVPPFRPDSAEEAGEDLRLKYRYIDLRRPALQRNLMLRDQVTMAVRNYFHEHGFIDLETPILTRSTPEGARDYLVPSRVHPGDFYALPQSPQIFKQILMASGFERYIQIARCFRDEDLRADRQPEFTQVDLEMSFIDEDQIMGLVEGLFQRIFPLAGIEPPATFPRMTYSEAMARFGSDRPDMRTDLEIIDLTERLGNTGFRGFKATAEAGGVIRALAVPGAAAASRRQVEEWAELARVYGAAGVLTLKRKEGEVLFQVKKALTDSEAQGAAEALGLGEGDLALIVAAQPSVAAAALGALRLAVAKQFDLLREDDHEFLWVTEFPLVDRDEERGRWLSLHHPFTSPDLRDLEWLDNDPGRVRSRAYDVVLNGTELGGGSIRIHQPEIQSRVFELLGIEPAEAERRFGFLLEALSFGAPPHGGIALGLDRLIMLMVGATSIRDVIPFPKTTSASCLMTQAPAPVEEEQLVELSLRLAKPKPAAEESKPAVDKPEPAVDK